MGRVACARGRLKDPVHGYRGQMIQREVRTCAKCDSSGHADIFAALATLREELDTAQSEAEIVKRMIAMCEQSLAPHHYEQFLSIIEQLRAVRKRLNGR